MFRNHMIPPGMLPTPMGPPQQIPGPGQLPMGQFGQQAAGLLSQTPQMPMQPGAFGGQAQQLAGLLGPQDPMMPQAPVYQPGLFMPGFRPGIDTPRPQGPGNTGSPRRRVSRL